MSSCHKLWFSNLYIFATWCRKPYEKNWNTKVKKIKKVWVCGKNSISVSCYIILLFFFICNFINTIMGFFDPIPAGVFLNQETLNPMFDVQIWQMIHWFESSYALLPESAKTFTNLEIFLFFCKTKLFSKMFAQKKIAQKMKNIHFWKGLDRAISNMQHFLYKILNNLMCN